MRWLTVIKEKAPAFIKNRMFLSMMFAVILFATIATIVVRHGNVCKVSSDFYERSVDLQENRSSSITENNSYLKKPEEQIVRLPAHAGGDPRARLAKQGVLGIMNGQVRGKSVASPDLFGKGGYSSGIDGVVNGIGGLKKSGSKGSGRRGAAGIGYGAGYGSGFGGSGAGGVDDIVGCLMGDEHGSALSFQSPGALSYQLTVREFNTEEYDPVDENPFVKVTEKPLSTFSIDVDRASYSNVRRFLNGNMLPPKDAVRIEELVNYFDYEYSQPDDSHPFSITTNVARCPWNESNMLVLVALQARKIALERMPPSNFVFLTDVSGSMDQPNKLPLLQTAMRMLAGQIRPEDQVAIVAYAGAAGLVLPSTGGSQKGRIIDAIESLRAGGSTAGGEGIMLAYQVAREHFLKNGNNRVILATDGDFNVGASSDAELVRIIETERKAGVYLTVLGFGTGNYKDAKMEKLADKGNGNFAYIDSPLEAQKTLVNEMGGTLLTVAKDVKLQVEFNPGCVQAYRLLGYENRRLNDEDFNDDTKDAGELGSGHTVTALYEVIPAGIETDLHKVDELKYQNRVSNKAAMDAKEILTVKFRYKKPEGDSTSILMTRVLETPRDLGTGTENLCFASAVAGFGMLLRNSKFKGTLTFSIVKDIAMANKGKDSNGYRDEFIRLVEQAERLKKGEKRG